MSDALLLRAGAIVGTKTPAPLVVRAVGDSRTALEAHFCGHGYGSVLVVFTDGDASVLSASDVDFEALEEAVAGLAGVQAERELDRTDDLAGGFVADADTAVG